MKFPKENKCIQTGVSILLATLILVACQSEPEGEITDRPISNTSSPRPSHFPAPVIGTNTDQSGDNPEFESKSLTKTSTLPPTSIDKSQLSREGPWLVFFDQSGLWVMNEDGSGLHQLYKFLSQPYGQFSYSISPRVGIVAFAEQVQSNFDEAFMPDLQSSPDLYIVPLPGTSLHIISPLIELSQSESIATQYPATPGFPSRNSSYYRIEQIKAAVSRPRSLAWSHSEDLLAFSAALDGPTSDLYVFNPRTGLIRRITSGLKQVVDIEWSANDDYIIHKAVRDINIGRDGPELSIDGLWAASPDGSDVHLLMAGQADVGGWLSPNHLLVYKWAMGCGNYDLYAVDIRSGGYVLLWRGPFEQTSLDPETGTILVGHGYPEQESDDPRFEGLNKVCPLVYPSGVYQIPGIYEEPLRIRDWNHANDRFGFHVYDVPITSPSGRLLAEHRERSIRILAENGDELFIQGQFCNLIWGSNDSTLLLSDDDGIYIALAPSYHKIEIPMIFTNLCYSDLNLVRP